MVKQLINLFKLRIGVIMSVTAVVALAVTPGQPVAAWEIAVLALAVLVAAGGAGAFNQYYEVDLDRKMRRTRNRPFITGEFQHSKLWLFLIAGLVLIGVAGAGFALNGKAAMHIFLGAFFYAIVYTVLLKRRTWLNIVIGGASGSFAVLAGASVADPSGIGPIPALLATVLFLWTPSHFWSLAIARHDDYAAAGVPMLPVVVGDHAAAKVILGNTLALVSISILPFFFGLGWIYLLGAVSGGGYFIYRNLQLVNNTSCKTAMTSFFASLVQLGTLLVCAILDVSLLG
ncbi:Heme O synthase, protoheme IX farnesyltransferase COX10-CtaB [hydrothermal vent metagenome]|uniref:Heme O synthase, protoheme IX farnesyltransferase COX10-CtaB n=1 Tax=hydrothermal vent metagenome TaxID=652676 RepID=A0A3B1AX70_9ZZZZ